MAVIDYNKRKKISVTSQNDSGSTIEKAQAVLLTGGDDSATGTGDIVLDWTNISSESDIAVYDQDGNLLPYEIESFDATAETAVLWTYSSWVRDDSVQAQVVYGDSPTSSEENITGTWPSDAIGVYHFNDANAPLTDSSGSGNDEVEGAISDRNVTGRANHIGNAYRLDGTDDYINVGDRRTTGELTVVAMHEPDDTSGSDTRVIANKDDFQTGDREYQLYGRNSGASNPETYDASFTTDTDGFNRYNGFGTFVTGEVDHVVHTYDEDTSTDSANFYENASNIDSRNISGSIPDTGQEEEFGRAVNGNYYSGYFSEIRVYGNDKSAEWVQADYDASPKAGQVFFSQQAAETTLTADITDFNKKKKLEVTDTNDAGATISKAQPIVLTDGSGTGTGSVAIDWTNISGPEDIAVFDETEAVLDYEIEEIDTTNNTGVIWVYNDWVRDGSVQAKLAYGDNDANTDRQNTTGTWNNTGQNAVMVQHLQDDPLTATDSVDKSTGTVDGATATTGLFDGAASFDNVDDYIDAGDKSLDNATNSGMTAVYTFKPDFNTDSSGPDDLKCILNGQLDFSNNFKALEWQSSSAEWRVEWSSSAFNFSSNNYNGEFVNAVTTFDDSDSVNAEVFFDGSSVATGTFGSGQTVSGTIPITIGARDANSPSEFWSGKIDEARLYDDKKSNQWIQADYDASPKAGQTFFSQQAAESTITGTITDINSNPVQGAEVIIINPADPTTSSGNYSDPSNWSVAAKTTTDSNGEYSVTVEAGKNYHVIAQNPNDTDVDGPSKPFIEV